MRSRLTRLTVLLPMAVVAAAAIAVPGAHAAAGATYREQLDAPPPASEPWNFNTFFPRGLSVHQGDVVQLEWGGTESPHTATAIPSSNPNAWRANNQGPGGPQDPAAFPWTLLAPDATVGGDDAEIVLNPAVAAPTSSGCGDVANPCPFDGTSVVSSGFQVSNPGSQPSFYVNVTAPVGQYSFLCLLHPGMQATLDVVGASTTIPDPTQVADRLTKQVHHAKTVDGPNADAMAQLRVRQPLAHGRSRWVINAGGFWDGASANEFPDAGLRVHVGDRIRVLGNFEIHTATVPKSSFKTTPLVVTQCEVTGPDTPATSPADCSSPSKFELAFNNTAIQPTPSLSLKSPGKFVNSGVIANPEHETFTAERPGTYTFVCLVHGPEMSTTVTVS